MHLKIRVAVGLFVAALASLTLHPAISDAAEFKAVTEYRYPTEYQVTPITRVGPNGITEVVGGIVTPSSFETREVGVSITVEASLYAPGAGIVDIAFIEPAQGVPPPFIVAAASGDKGKLIKLIGAKPPVNAQDRVGSTALIGASAGGFLDIVTLLCKLGADVNLANHSGATPLLVAARNGHLKVVKSLLDQEAKIDQTDAAGRTPLMEAARRGHADIVKLLADHGANPSLEDRSGKTALALARQRQPPQTAAQVLVQTQASAKP